MLQTNAAEAMLSGAGLDKPQTKAGKSSEDAGEFSQEFDKQVKKVNDSVRDSGAPQAHDGQSRTAGKPDGMDKSEGDATTEQTEQAHKKVAHEIEKSSVDKLTAEQSQKGEATVDMEKTAQREGGKGLPQELAAMADELKSSSKQESESKPDLELKEKAQPDLESRFVTPESKRVANEQFDAEILEVPLHHIEGKPDMEEQVQPEADEALPVNALQLFRGTDTSKTSSEIREIKLEGEAASSNARLRDVLAQRMFSNSGGEGSDVSAGRQGKAELNSMLTSQFGQNRTSGGFEHMLNGAAFNTNGSLISSVAQPAAASVPATMTLAVPMQQQGWGEAMGERVMWMARSNIQQAQIQLNPRDLGPIEIKVSMQNDQANVHFVAHHATTRDALEAAIPRLRDMFNEQGLNLGQADVSQHSFSGDNPSAGAQDSDANGSQSLVAGDDAADGDMAAVSHISHIGPSGVDYFA